MDKTRLLFCQIAPSIDFIISSFPSLKNSSQLCGGSSPHRCTALHWRSWRVSLLVGYFAWKFGLACCQQSLNLSRVSGIRANQSFASPEPLLRRKHKTGILRHTKSMTLGRLGGQKRESPYMHDTDTITPAPQHNQNLTVISSTSGLDQPRKEIHKIFSSAVGKISTLKTNHRWSDDRRKKALIGKKNRR